MVQTLGSPLTKQFNHWQITTLFTMLIKMRRYGLYHCSQNTPIGASPTMKEPQKQYATPHMLRNHHVMTKQNPLVRNTWCDPPSLENLVSSTRAQHPSSQTWFQRGYPYWQSPKNVWLETVWCGLIRNETNTRQEMTTSPFTTDEVYCEHSNHRKAWHVSNKIHPFKNLEITNSKRYTVVPMVRIHHENKQTRTKTKQEETWNRTGARAKHKGKKENR